MPTSILKSTMIAVQPLTITDTVGDAAQKVIEAGLPALPVVDDKGSLKGVFGEREFITAVFPGYVGSLKWAAWVPGAIGDELELRRQCLGEPIRNYLTAEDVAVEGDRSDVAVAETFLHHRVLIVPITTGGKVQAVVTRSDFFRTLAEKLSPGSAGDSPDTGGPRA
jgi:CBS domain-containing protein